MSDTQPLALPIDYYELLGLTPAHLLPPPPRPMHATRRIDERVHFDERLEPPRPPSSWEVDQAALRCEQTVRRMATLSAGERDVRLNEIELARRILGDEQHRRRYDMILLTWRQGLRGADRHRALRHLQEEVWAAIQLERGERLDVDEQAALLRRGQDALMREQYDEAIRLLGLARTAQPDALMAHYDYARALLRREDPLVLPVFPIKQAIDALESVCRLDGHQPRAQALLAFCRGLLDRDAGRAEAAQAWFKRAVQADGQLGVAWRALAVGALQSERYDDALAHCRRALAIDARDERTLLIAAAACLRQDRRAHALEVATVIAGLRGAPWTAERVLSEFEA